MVVYIQDMMKKTQKAKSEDEIGAGEQKLSPRAQALILPLFVAIGIGAIALAVFAIIIMPRINPGSQRGVGAYGFQAFVEENSTLGVDKVVEKKDVEDVLGDKAKSVDNVDVAKVFNYDGTRGQQVTYQFTRADGLKSSIYIDLFHFKNQAALDSQRITNSTISAGTINGHPAYFMHALTFGSNREYSLLVVNGLKVYKFAMVQPYRIIAINEVASGAVLKRLAERAHL